MPGIVIASVVGVAVGLVVWRLIPTEEDLSWIPAIILALFGSFAGIGLAASFVQTELPLPEGWPGWSSSLAGSAALGGLYAMTSRRRLANDGEPS